MAWYTPVTAFASKVKAADWNSLVTYLRAHATDHKAGGIQPIKLDEFATPTDITTLNATTTRHGLCPKFDGNTAHFLRSDGTQATPPGAGDVTGPGASTANNLPKFAGTTGKILSDSGVGIASVVVTTDPRLSDARNPNAHKTSHQDGGTDEINVAGLTGLLATAQTPASHVHAATDVTSGTLSGDRLPALSTTKRGGVPATGTPAGKYLKDNDTFDNPVSASAVMGPASAASGNVVQFDGATGKLISDSGVVAANLVITSDSRLTNARTPTAHAASHKTGASDVILLDEFGTPNDNTNLNASTARHGLLPKGNNLGKYLRDNIVWTSLVEADVAGLVTDLALKAPVANPTFTGTVITPALKITTGADAGDMLISDADGDLSYLAAGATNQILVGGGAANPVWTAATGTGAPVRAGSPIFTGTVTIPTINLTGGQIAFPATQVPSADPNTLDEYEEGLWTPVLAFGGSSTGIMYSVQYGSYTRTGRFISGNAQITLTSKGTDPGAATINGLPFVSGGSNAVSVYLNKITFANQFMAYNPVGTAIISLKEITEAGAVSNLTNNDFANDSAMILSCRYAV